MPSPDVIFRQLFLICAASFLCEILAENAHISSSKGLHAALKTVCALCVCVTFFSLFGDSGTFEADISFAFDSVSSAAETAPADGVPDNADGLSAVIERTQTVLEERISDAIKYLGFFYLLRCFSLYLTSCFTSASTSKSIASSNVSHTLLA